jgi:cytidine deaminase
VSPAEKRQTDLDHERLTKAREAMKAAIRDFLFLNSEGLGANDEALVNNAKSGIVVRYLHGWIQTFAVGIDKKGRMISRPNSEQNIGSISSCAEPFMLNDAEYEMTTVDTVVVVRRQRPDEGTDVHVVTPCGSCRERIMHHNPNAWVIVWIGGKYNVLRKIRIEFLLPLPYKQRVKPNGNGLSTHEFEGGQS